MKKILLLISFFISFNGISQNTSREGVAVVIATVLYGDSYNYNNNPANNYPSPWVDIDTGVTDGQILNIISRLDYGDGITPFPFINDGSNNFHPTGFMPRASAVLAVVEAWNIPITADFTSPFNDIPDGYALLPWINAAYNAGIIFGVNFFPENPVQNQDIIDWVISAHTSPFGGITQSTLNNSDNYFLPHLYVPENLGMFKGLEQAVFSHYAKNSFVIPDVQMNLNFSHFYSTTMVELPESFFPIQPLGRGWSHTYNIYAQRQFVDTDGDGDEEELFYITWADGTIHIYNFNLNEWITEGVYNEAVSFSQSGVPHLNVFTKDHMQYRFRRIDDDREIFYLVNIADRNGNDMDIEYEIAEAANMRRIERVIAPSGKELEFSYENGTDLIDEIEDPINREIDFGYANGRLRRFFDAKNNETEYFYFSNDDDNNFERFLLDEVELPRGNSIKATYDNNSDGYLSSYQVNDNTPINYAIDVDYNESMPVTIAMDVPMPDGGTDLHTSQYNSLGLLESFESGTDDIVIDYPSPNASNPFLPSQVSNHNIDIEYEYDNNGNIEVIEYENFARDYRFNWNSENDLVYSIDPRGNRTDYEYDNDHNLITITDPLNNDIVLDYFSNGNLRSITNQEGITIDFTYYTDGSLQTFTAPENIGGSFTYDGINRLLSKTVNGLTSNYNYDDNDNITNFTNSGGFTTVFDYDDNDNVASITNANNVQTIFEYNNRDQVTSETYGNLETEYDYNDDDTLNELEKPSGQAIVLDYTSDGQYNGSGTVTDVDYDSNERVDEIASQDLRYIFSYDVLNQIELVEIQGQERNVGYEYDPAGNITKIFYPNMGSEAYVRYQYDDKNRLSVIRTVDFENFPNTVIADYEYLDDDRISQITYGNGFITYYQYDNAGRPIGILHENNNEIYYQENRVLDNRGNVTSLSVGYLFEGTPIYEPSTEEQNFQYNDNNHITLAGYTINDDGNTVNSPIGNFVYDIDDQARQRIVGDVSYVHRYDPFGNRTERITSNGINREYVWDIVGKNIIQEYNQGSPVPRNFLYGLGLEAQIVNGAISYYHGDLRGNVVLLTDVNGERIRDYQYGPFGDVQNVNPGPNPDNNEFTFLGKQGIIEDDRDAGLYYIRARYYDASIGRFITEDPVQSSNLYVYGGNNPIKNIDRNGEIIETAADIVSLGASIYDFSSDPSLTNGLFLAWDIVGLVPGVPGSWSAKAVKYGASYGDELLQGASLIGKDNTITNEIAENVSVYVSKNFDGTVQYVGITNDISRRSVEHRRIKNIEIEELIPNLSRTDAKAVEQALIEMHGLQKDGGTLINKINSISSTNPKYADQLRRGLELLKTIGY